MALPAQGSFFLFGPRGTGKSTWLEAALPKALRIDLLRESTFVELAGHAERMEAMADALDTRTLVIDEGDFRLSDEKAEIIKILNNGNARGFPVLRSEVTPQKEYNPTAYAVFGPKLVATRSMFEDRALESRWKRPVIPVFWVPGDDHDFDEVSSASWLGGDGESWERGPELPKTEAAKPKKIAVTVA